VSDHFPPDFAVPLVALDRVLRLDDSGIVTRKDVVSDEPFFAGHFPGYPIYPGVFIIEAVHQAASQYGMVFLGRVKLLEVRSARFLAPVYPGDILESDCRCEVFLDAGELMVAATCRCGTRTVAEIKLRYHLENTGASQSRAD
jgi:3-hydroxyacyl-[acyl-carrier-protein] dehydratase